MHTTEFTAFVIAVIVSAEICRCCSIAFSCKVTPTSRDGIWPHGWELWLHVCAIITCSASYTTHNTTLWPINNFPWLLQSPLHEWLGDYALCWSQGLLCLPPLINQSLSTPLHCPYSELLLLSSAANFMGWESRAGRWYRVVNLWWPHHSSMTTKSIRICGPTRIY